LQLLILLAQEETGQLAVPSQSSRSSTRRKQHLQLLYFISFSSVCPVQYNNCCVSCDESSLVDLVRSSVDLPPVV
jgi:hypothetical protein